MSSSSQPDSSEPTPSTPIAAAALLVAILAVVALASRPAPRPAPPRASASALVVAEGAPRAITAESPLDLSTATAIQIEALPRVGPAMAERIVAARQGPGLRSLEDLDAVRGVGPSLLATLSPLVRFSAAGPSAVANPAHAPASEAVEHESPAKTER